jgi:hypothetical protein
MLLLVSQSFAASKREPFGTAAARLYDAFLAAGLGAPRVRFRFADHAPLPEAMTARVPGLPQRVSAVDRALKRYPELARFLRPAQPDPRTGGAAQAIANVGAEAEAEPVPFETLRAIADGVPKSYPFRAASLHFSAPEFTGGALLPERPDSAALRMLMRAGVEMGGGAGPAPGVGLLDSWWVNGRERRLSATHVVEADPGAKKLPPPPPPVVAVLAACGKARKTVQVPIADTADATAAPETDAALKAAMQAWRAELPAVAAALPYDVATRMEPLAGPSGPKKPELERVFGPRGYAIRGETGQFVLRRRSKAGLIMTLAVDVGTWSDSLSVHLGIFGMRAGAGFRLACALPTTRAQGGTLTYGQVRIGTPERWRCLVENLGDVVDAAERGLVPAIEAIAPDTPAWYQA